MKTRIIKAKEIKNKLKEVTATSGGYTYDVRFGEKRTPKQIINGVKSKKKLFKRSMNEGIDPINDFTPEMKENIVAYSKESGIPVPRITSTVIQFIKKTITHPYDIEVGTPEHLIHKEEDNIEKLANNCGCGGEIYKMVEESFEKEQKSSKKLQNTKTKGETPLNDLKKGSDETFNNTFDWNGLNTTSAKENKGEILFYKISEKQPKIGVDKEAHEEQMMMSKNYTGQETIVYDEIIKDQEKEFEEQRGKTLNSLAKKTKKVRDTAEKIGPYKKAPQPIKNVK